MEDDSSIRDIEIYALQTTGFEAKGFEDGVSFWEALQTACPRLVILDVMLPGMDGVTLLRSIKASEKLQSIPVIMATAKALFRAEGSWVGKSIFSIDRSRELRNAVNDALDQGHGTLRIQRNGRDYRLDLSRIQSGGTVVGAVMLAFDMTETLNAQRSRREFSANVSHELKTPPAIHHGQRRASGKRPGKTGGYVPVCRPHPQGGCPAAEPDRGYHPPLPAG